MHYFSAAILGMIASAAIAVPSTAKSTPVLTASKTFTCHNNHTAKFNCPTIGTLKKPAVIGAESSVATLNACRDICLSHSNCVSFKYVKSGGLCTQYSKDLPHMGLVKNKNAVGVMYNIHCFVCNNGTPIVSSTSSAASSSTPSSATSYPSSSATSYPSSSATSYTSSTITSSASSATTTYVSSAPVVMMSSSTTSTSSSPAASDPPPGVCGNAGLAWAQYPNNAGDNDDSTYSNFDPTAYKLVSPQCSGTTTTIAGFSAPGDGDAAFTVYGSSCTFNSMYFTLDHVGYFYASIPGTYTFQTQDTDDAVFLWVGENAVTGWNRDNANAFGDIRSDYGISQYQFTATEGSYTPIRIMFAQAQGGGGFRFRIYDPNMNLILQDGTPESGYIVQYGCGTDAQVAPAFPPWGNED